MKIRFTVLQKVTISWKMSSKVSSKCPKRVVWCCMFLNKRWNEQEMNCEFITLICAKIKNDVAPWRVWHLRRGSAWRQNEFSLSHTRKSRRVWSWVFDRNTKLVCGWVLECCSLILALSGILIFRNVPNKVILSTNFQWNSSSASFVSHPYLLLFVCRLSKLSFLYSSYKI